MSHLFDLQSKMPGYIAKLIVHAESLGYRLTLGDAYRDPRVFGLPGTFKGYGHTRSNHKYRCAIDFNLFIKQEDGSWKYCTSTDDHKPLGEYWESLGDDTRWGGHFSNPDGNHYEVNYRER
jgi:hypothetical protein